MTTIKHCNNVDYWLIIHKADNNSFLVYLIDKNGIHRNEVQEFKTGTGFTGSSEGLQQEIVNSEDGSVVAITKPIAPEGGFLETFAFDNFNGKITRKLATIKNLGKIRGTALSPDGKLVYVSRFVDETPISSNSYQYNYELRQFRTTEDQVFDNTIYTDSFNGQQSSATGGELVIEPGPFGNLKLGPNGKIYLAHEHDSHLSVIESPNEEGLNCNFQPFAFSLDHRQMGSQLPATISPDYRPAEAKIIFEGDSISCNPILKAETKGYNQTQITYSWYLGDSLLSSQTKATLRTVGPGSYSAVINDACRKLRTNTKVILTGGDVPPPHSDTLITSCAYTELKRLNVPGQNLKWYSDESLNTLISQSNDFEVPLDYNTPQSKTFYLTQTQNHCESEAAKITFQIIDNTPIEFVDSLIQECFTGKNGIKPELVYDFPGELVWYKDGEFFSNDDSPLIFRYGTYTVKRADNRCSAEDSIRIEDGCMQLFLPSSFSPNGDGVNEEFKVFGNGVFEIDFEIIDRNNQLMAEIENHLFNAQEMILWDGTIDQKPAPSGLYFYVIKIRNQVDKTIPEEIRTGSIMLIR